jgi:hypothetical protein
MPVYEVYVGRFEWHSNARYVTHWKFNGSQGERTADKLDSVINEILHSQQGLEFDKVSLDSLPETKYVPPISPISEEELSELRRKFVERCERDSVQCTLVPAESPPESHNTCTLSAQLS